VGEELERRVETGLVRLTFDGDDLVLDERALRVDDEAVTTSGPDSSGRYVVMGYRCTGIRSADDESWIKAPSS